MQQQQQMQQQQMQQKPKQMQPGGPNPYMQPIKGIGSHFGTGPGPGPGPGMSPNPGMTGPGDFNNQMGGWNPVRIDAIPPRFARLN